MFKYLLFLSFPLVLANSIWFGFATPIASKNYWFYFGFSWLMIYLSSTILYYGIRNLVKKVEKKIEELPQVE